MRRKQSGCEIPQSEPRRFKPSSDDEGVSLGGHLPDSLLVDILARLPLKSIYRFKCVSKHWLSLISNPFFRLCYLRRFDPSLSAPSPWTFLQQYMPVSRLEDIHCDDPSEVASPGFPSRLVRAIDRRRGQHEGILIVVLGTCNGQILYKDAFKECDWGYCVFSPVTGQRVLVPPRPSPRLQNVMYGFVCRVEDEMIKSFKIVAMPSLNIATRVIILEVFSSETHQWRKQDLFSLNSSLQVNSSYGLVPFRGILHCFNCRNSLIAYDPYRNPEQSRHIPLPLDSAMRRGYKCNTLCGESRGYLRYLEIVTNSVSELKLWVLNDYDNGEWLLEHSCRDDDIVIADEGLMSFSFNSPYSCVRPLAFHPNDMDVVYFIWKSTIASFNTRTKRLDTFCNTPRSPKSNVYELYKAFPFVVPLWPAPILLTRSEC